jgi:hypothetical protein
MIARNRLSSEKTALVRVRLHQSPAAIAKAHAGVGRDGRESP